jgi:single-strand DNA-binding protein
MSRELKLPSLNKILIAGNCTRDPEVRYMQSGTAMCRIGLASSRYYRDPKDSAGEWKEDTCFVNVVVWGQLAERMGDQLKKGTAVLVEGRLQSRSWEADDGTKRSAIEINADRVQVLERRGGSEGAPAYAASSGGRESDSSSGSDMSADDLPF